MPFPLTGQAVGVDLSTPVALSGPAIQCAAFIIKAPLTNATAVFIGWEGISNSTGHQLDPGDEFSYERSTAHGHNRYELSVSDFYMVGIAPDKVTWLASPL